jgi:hypothetical protein
VTIKDIQLRLLARTNRQADDRSPIATSRSLIAQGDAQMDGERAFARMQGVSR